MICILNLDTLSEMFVNLISEDNNLIFFPKGE